MKIKNSYDDAVRANAYARLDFPGTYYLAYRDLPEILANYVTGTKALDFGCGTGRSTRFLNNHGCTTIGVDVAGHMIHQAQAIDPDGDYRVVGDCDLGCFENDTFDLVMCAFSFDNIPTMERKIQILIELERVLREDGRIINLVSSPDIYRHEWASFSTKDFPENKYAKCGDPVRIIVTDIDDERPVEDVLWPDQDYREAFRRAGLELIGFHKPLGRENELQEWVNETRIAPWVIYVLRKSGGL
jgi:ubiquinone/menaquinone biosynthesis C-methylase UbiE